MNIDNLPDKETLERIKIQEDINQMTSPFWRKSSFYTVIISVISISITALIGYSAFIKAQDEQLELLKDQIATQQADMQKERNALAREESKLKNEILALQLDTLRFFFTKAQFDYTRILLENNSVQKNLSNLEEKEDALQKLINEQNTLLSYVTKQKADLLQQKDNLNASNEDLRKEAGLIGFKKEKEELISNLFGLKSDLITLITPSEKTFSGKFLNVVSNVNIHKPESDETSISRVNERLDMILIHPFINENRELKIHYNELRSMINQLTQKRFKSNRYIHNSRILLGQINPKVELLISKAQQLSEPISLPIR